MKKLLNLPTCLLKLQQNKDNLLHNEDVFDIIRKQWVAYTPEEMVRQYFVHYLINHLSTPTTHIGIERSFKFSNGKSQRADIVVYSGKGEPFMLVECKAPTVKISNDTFTQATRYNAYIKAKYIVVTNGIKHFCAVTDDYINYTLCNHIPKYN